ncbi:MAG: glycosyltransferase family 4 protein [Chrysiogenia bacterium]
MRVIHIVNLQNFGGIETLVTQLSEHQLEKQQLDVRILTPLKNKKTEVIPRKLKLEVINGRLNSGFDFNLKKLWEIYKIFRAEDIIHFHGFNVFLFICAILANKRIIYTEHGTFQRTNQYLSLRKFIKKRIIGYFFLRYFTDKVVFNSKWLLEKVGLKSKNNIVILNGIDIDKNHKIKTVEDELFRILTVGRFIRKKRIDRLIKGISYIEKKAGVRLELVGDGSDYKYLEKLANAILPKESFLFHGFQKNVEEYYSKSNLFVLPTEGEPFGMVVLEAMLHEIPVICFSDGGGALEIVDDIHPRLIVNDEKDLARAIEFWRDHKVERELVGKKLRQHVVEKFSLKRMASDYLRLYSLVMGSSIHPNSKTD